MTTTADPLETGRAVAALTAAGRSITQIAAQLGITPRTVTRWRARRLPVEAAPSGRWQHQAACRDTGDPSWFLPPDETRPGAYTRGRAVCAPCPVRDACLNDALTREGNAAPEDRAGLWGGLSPQQRAHTAAVRAPRVAPVRSRVEDTQARHRDELLAALRETA